ncbi:MAG TPA: type IX secretion system membrane protein PorP/SprF [Chitinophagaceae bacterium]|jgi:type IX secretion system PorP/SprF family membrane protein|nr:type IX secretion system membrane protein PorP/SprF [Chitinophagaceae bacterium]
MKKILISAFGMITCLVGMGQQRPHYTQYLINPYIINPAITGIENYTDVKLSIRDQWVGLNGAPRTVYFTVHGPLGKKDYRESATSFRVPGENPRGRAYWETYTAAEPHHGLGLTVINDKTGSFSKFSASATYAYHLGLTPTTNLSAGFSAGISRVGIDKGKQDFGGGTFDDPAVGAAASGVINKIRPDVGFGLWLYSRDFFIGLAGQQVVPQKLMYVDDDLILTKGKLVPHLFFTAGYRFLLSDDINAIPSLMVKYTNGVKGNEFQPEMNVKFQYRDQLWLGGGYRYKDGYAAMMGLNVSNTFNVSYSYDFTSSPLNTVSKGTHEIVLGFIIGNKYSEACPRCY